MKWKKNQTNKSKGHACTHIPKEEPRKFEVWPQASEAESHSCDSGSQRKCRIPDLSTPQK